MAEISSRSPVFSTQGFDMRELNFGALIASLTIMFQSSTTIAWRFYDNSISADLGGIGLAADLNGGLLVAVTAGEITGFSFRNPSNEFVYRNVSIQAADFMALVNAADWGGLARAFTAGDDTIRGSRNDDTLLGGAGNDFMPYSYLGDDRMNGGAGNDTLRADHGRDVMTGGNGDDAFWFDSMINGRADVDRITDFTGGEDKIWLANDLFPLGPEGRLSAANFVRGAQATTAEEHLIYRQATGRLFFDYDGSGASEKFLFMVFDPGTVLSARDFLIV